MLRLTLILFLFHYSLLFSNENREYFTARIKNEAPIVDGIINDESWNDVEWSGNFTQTIPYEKQKPSQETEIKILYDDNYVYVAFKCYDTSPDSIDRRLSRRDAFDGDWVQISFDSYHDLRTAFSFSVNATGVKSDGTVSNDGNNFDSNWDPIWYVKTNIDSEGWSAEMKIPFTQLRFAQKENYTWGIQAARQIYRKNEESLWKFKSPNVPGWVSHYGFLYGINNIKPKKQKEIVPYIVAKTKSYKKEVGNPYALGRDNSASFGVDGKLGLTNDLTFDFTVNPDFGQVEADPSEMNLSTFETYFDEKRPFFIEGRSIMNYYITQGWWELSSDNGFYSRRIGHKPWFEIETTDDEYVDYPDNTTILGAFKVTGKTQKGLSVGILESVTQQEMAEIDSAGHKRKVEVEPLSNYFICRLQQDINNSNTQIGTIISATNRKITSPDLRDVMAKDAYTLGFDIHHEWNEKKYYLYFSTLYSNIQGSKEAILNTQLNAPYFFQRTDASHLSVDSIRTSLDGLSGTLRFGSNGNGKWMYSTWITYRSPGFDINETGYMRTSDIIQQVNWLGYRQKEAKGIVRFLGLNFNQWNAFTFGGERIYINENFNGHITFTNMWGGGCGFSRRSSAYFTNELRGGPSLLVDGAIDYFSYLNSDHRRKISVYAEHNGERFDHALYKRDNFYLQFNFKFIDQLDFSVMGAYKKLINNIQYIDNIDYLNETRYIRGRMKQNETSLTFRLNLYLTPDLSIQYYGMPFISAGKFSDFKYIDNAKAAKLTDRYKMYTDDQVKYVSAEQTYYIDENLDGTNDYSFQPDFNAYDFNSNLVFRWEYKPGSLLYIVWSQNRNNTIHDGNFKLGNDIDNLFRVYPTNVFLIKLSYRIGV